LKKEGGAAKQKVLRVRPKLIGPQAGEEPLPGRLNALLDKPASRPSEWRIFLMKNKTTVEKAVRIGAKVVEVHVKFLAQALCRHVRDNLGINQFACFTSAASLH
jgi:hypothetical protein